MTEDPKAQGAIQLEKMENATTKKILKEGQKLLKEYKDFILEPASGKVCKFEREDNRIDKNELDRKIQRKFKGKLYKNIDLYASKLPIDTQVFHVNEDGTDFLYAEVSNGKDRIYSCEYFYGK
ncbi:hypothetical protein [Fictibacillus sp. BK138]|uniref:hypothetical protein n=1 Tax=Fictibacillus sp. BK138 TaxID=2512121 RepID=UPI00102A2EF6|nr:hypothetical protein [Fictibacillus sp. BK138]